MITIRPTIERDAEMLCAIQKQAFEPLYERYHDEGNSFLRGISYKYMGRVPFIDELKEGVYYLQRVYITPNRQRKGIARTAILLCEKEFPDANIFYVDFPGDLVKNRKCYDNNHKVRDDMYDIILFDLDGTLTESAEGITNSVIFALGKMGIEETDKDKLKAFVGPPLDESFMKYYGFDKEGAKEAIANYRIYYREKGIFEAPLYANVEKTLVQLTEEGKRLFVATSKPEVFAKQILEHWGIAHLFTDIVGSNLDGSKINKDEVITSLFERNGIMDKAKVLMVGDREHDVMGAKKVGVACVGVLYGYGNYEELEKAGADYIVEKIEDILSIIWFEGGVKGANR